MSEHPAKAIDFRPRLPRNLDFGIGLIGCGGITEHHLQAYQDAGWKVHGLCDKRLEAARHRQQQYFPNAHVYDDYRQLLRDDRIQVVDIATHPPERPAIIRECLLARKHVLSQKPFVIDIEEGHRLCDLADQQQVRLAVNQNARFAPHFCYARRAIQAGILGQTFAAHMSVHWDHSWVQGSPFEKVKHLILYDYAIHWFDMLRCLLPHSKPTRVFASTTAAPDQKIMPNLLGQVLIEWDSAQATLAFDGALPKGSQERMFVSGTKGSLECVGPEYQPRKLTITTQEGGFQPELEGQWFPDAFRGTMGELLCSIDENRPCELDARDNLISLCMCFAAVASSNDGMPKIPESVLLLPN